jgi:hypothetical protein
MPDPSPRTKKSRRCFQRVISGIKRGGTLRFLTLTSSDAAPEDIQRSWRCLYMRLKRRGLVQGYIKVPETKPDGRTHLHVLFRGSYIEQRIIKHMWENIHQSSIVDIRLVKVYKNPAKVANYMAKYMSKEMAGRYSWSWWWVWPGFCRDWTIYKRWWWKFIDREGITTFKNLLYGWDCILTGRLEADFTAMSAQCRYEMPFNVSDFFPLHHAASAHTMSRPSVNEPAQQVALTGVIS